MTYFMIILFYKNYLSNKKFSYFFQVLVYFGGHYFSVNKMNCSVIDIGANTIRLSIFAIEKNKPVLLFNKKQTCGLANYNERGFLSKDGVEVLITTLKKFSELLLYYPVEKKYVFATASLRNVKNSKKILEIVKSETGINIDLLSGKEEANLGFLGISKSVKNIDTGITVDIGGGSTEVVYFENSEVKEIFNLDEGCLSLHKKFVKGIMPKKSELKKIRAYLQEKTKGFTPENKAEKLIGIGGTIRTTGKLLADLKVINGKRNFKSKDVDYLYQQLLEKKSKKPLDSLMKVAPDRIHTIQTGLIIFMMICDIFGVEIINVSTFGLREGYVINKLV